MNIKHQKHFFDINKICQHINVEKPYFAFQQLWQEGELLVGNFVSEQPLAYESGPIAIGEIGRHLAILGSCAAVALQNGPEGYYLATKAHLMCPSQTLPSADTMYYANAKVLDCDNRNLKILAKAWGKEHIAEFICEYAILAPSSFQRNFMHYADANLPAPLISPYQDAITIDNLVFGENEVSACAGPLSALQCAGHFPGYPCWPAAIISQTAFQVTGELIKKKYGENMRFSVQHATLAAKKLTCANTALKFKVEIMTEAEKLPLIKCVIHAYDNDHEVVELINLIKLISLQQ